jgi:hypothetical protein
MEEIRMNKSVTVLLIMLIVVCSDDSGDQTFTIDVSDTDATIDPIWDHQWAMWGTGYPNRYSDWDDDWFKDAYPFCNVVVLGNMTGGMETYGNNWIKDDGQGGSTYDYTNLKETMEKFLPAGVTPLIVFGTTPPELSGDNDYHGSEDYGNVLHPTSWSAYETYLENVVNQMESYVSDYNTAHSTSYSVNDWYWRDRTEINNPNWFYDDAPCDYGDWTGPGDWDQYYVDNDNRDAYFNDYDYTLSALVDAIGANNIELFGPAHVSYVFHTWGPDIIEHCYDNSKRMDYFGRTLYSSVGGTADRFSTIDSGLDTLWTDVTAEYGANATQFVCIDEFGLQEDENGDSMSGEGGEFGASFAVGSMVTGVKHGHCGRIVNWDHCFPHPWSEPYSTRVNMASFNALMLMDTFDGLTEVAVSPEYVSSSGKRLEVLAAKDGDTIRAIVYHHYPAIDRDNAETSEDITLTFNNLSAWEWTHHVRQWRVDRYNSNSGYLWLAERTASLWQSEAALANTRPT